MIRSSTARSCALAAAVILTAPRALTADTLFVPGQFPTIQAAMDAAQEGDTVLVADGVYTGPGNTFLSFDGKGFLVRSENGPSSCIIDCEGGPPAFWFVADEPPTAVVDGFTIQRGGGGSGGAVFLHHGGQPTFRRCVFVDNTSSNGGAILAENTSKLTLRQCVFLQNSAARGGALHVRHVASATVLNCVFEENVATVDGGAIWTGSFGRVDVRSSTLVRNTAFNAGGAVYAGGTLVDLRGLTLADNVAGLRGGALAVDGPANAILSDSILWADMAPLGPEIALLTHPTSGGSELTVRYSIVRGGAAAIAVDPGSALAYGPGNLELDPLFVDGPGGDYHLTLASPARGAGDPEYVPLPGELDIDGQPRIFPPRVDMGSDEVHPYQPAR